MFEEAIISDPNPGYFYHKGNYIKLKQKIGEILRILKRNEEMVKLYERAFRREVWIIKKNI